MPIVVGSTDGSQRHHAIEVQRCCVKLLADAIDSPERNGKRRVLTLSYGQHAIARGDALRQCRHATDRQRIAILQIVFSANHKPGVV